MTCSFSISAEIVRAMHCPADIERTQALRHIAHLLWEPTATQDFNGWQGKPDDTDRREQNLARVLDSLRRGPGQCPMGEMEIVGFALDHRLDHAVCGLAMVTGLSVSTIETAFSAISPDLLLIACRMINFAWSSTSHLLSLRGVSAGSTQLDELAVEYHQIPIPVAQRFGRFLQVHSTAPDPRRIRPHGLALSKSG